MIQSKTTLNMEEEATDEEVFKVANYLTVMNL